MIDDSMDVIQSASEDCLIVSEKGVPEKPENFATIDVNRQQNGLLWSMTDVRRLFNDYRMWPTFVGPRFLIYGVSRITLPVLLWKEQESYLKNATEQTVPSSSSAKRKRSDADDQVHSLTEQTLTRARKCDSNITNAVNKYSEEENTRNMIFQDLHDRKYFVGPADAYGGDYSLYKGGGDPTQTHSIATVRVIEKGHKITAKELLAFSRVQNQVAKSAVLAFKLPTEQADITEDSRVGTEEPCSKEREASTVGYIMINFRNVSDRV